MARTVLCIDDNENCLCLTRSILEENGYYVFTASTGLEGLELLDTQSIDCILLDFNMPGMDGAGVADEVAHRRRRPPIILYSGCCDLPNGILKNIRAVVDKVGDVKELLKCVETVLITSTVGSAKDNHEHGDREVRHRYPHPAVRDWLLPW